MCKFQDVIVFDQNQGQSKGCGCMIYPASTTPVVECDFRGQCKHRYHVVQHSHGLCSGFTCAKGRYQAVPSTEHPLPTDVPAIPGVIHPKDGSTCSYHQEGKGTPKYDTSFQGVQGLMTYVCTFENLRQLHQEPGKLRRKSQLEVILPGFSVGLAPCEGLAPAPRKETGGTADQTAAAGAAKGQKGKGKKRAAPTEEATAPKRARKTGAKAASAKTAAVPPQEVIDLTQDEQREMQPQPATATDPSAYGQWQLGPGQEQPVHGLVALDQYAPVPPIATAQTLAAMDGMLASGVQDQVASDPIQVALNQIEGASNGIQDADESIEARLQRALLGVGMGQDLLAADAGDWAAVANEQPAVDAIQPATDSFQPAADSFQEAGNDVQAAGESFLDAGNDVLVAGDDFQGAGDDLWLAGDDFRATMDAILAADNDFQVGSNNMQAAGDDFGDLLDISLFQ